MKKKLFTLLFLSVFVTINCQSQNKSVKGYGKYITVTYDKPINGYAVEVLWYPKYVRFDNIVGAAILEFTKLSNSEHFTITTNHFAVPQNKVQASINQEGFEIEKLITSNLKLNYRAFKLAPDGKIGNSQTQFFFFDLNSDGNKELIITEFAVGQRDINAYKAYSFDDGSLVYDLYQITYEAPYISLDDLTKITKSNKEIEIYDFGGACHETIRTYRLTDKGSMGLAKITKYDRDDEKGKCYKYVYEVKNGIKKLLSKTESNF